MRARHLSYLAVATLLAMSAPTLPASAGGTHSLTVVSDTSGVWVDHFVHRTGLAVLTYKNVGCTRVNARGFCKGGVWPSIPGAHWVWNRRNQTPNHALHGQRPLNFFWYFTLPRSATGITGTLRITVDNGYRVSLNSVKGGRDCATKLHGDCRPNGGWPSIETWDIHPRPGFNTIKVRAVNYPGPADPYYSPAGLIFRADITYST